jgi:hypothetical protein
VRLAQQQRLAALLALVEVAQRDLAFAILALGAGGTGKGRKRLASSNEKCARWVEEKIALALFDVPGHVEHAAIKIDLTIHLQVEGKSAPAHHGRTREVGPDIEHGCKGGYGTRRRPSPQPQG